jgi:hypothetical protein
MYTKPVSTVSDERDLVTWEDGTMVNITGDQEKECAIDIVEKKINLNGEALGSLFAGFVLGQQSFEKPLSPAEETKWKEKMAKLKTFKDINKDVPENSDDRTQIADDVKDKESQEKDDVKEFLEKWGKLPGFTSE